MSGMLDFFFEFASTYSYPAAMRIGDVARSARVVSRMLPATRIRSRRVVPLSGRL